MAPPEIPKKAPNQKPEVIPPPVQKDVKEAATKHENVEVKTHNKLAELAMQVDESRRPEDELPEEYQALNKGQQMV